MQNWNSVSSAVESSMESEGSAFRENEAYMDSIEAKMNQLTVASQTMWSNAINTDLIKSLVDIGTSLVQVIDKIGLFNVGLIGIFFTMAKFKDSAITQMLLSLSNIIKGMIPFLNTTTASLGANSTATNANTTSKVANTVATEANAGANVALGTSATFATKAVAVLKTALGLLPLVAVAGLLYGLYKAFDSVHTSTEEYKEKVDELKTELNEYESELTSISTQLKEIANRMDELNGKSHLTFVEKEELRNLERTNEQLQIQARLLKEKSDIANKELAETTKENYDKDMKKQYQSIEKFSTVQYGMDTFEAPDAVSKLEYIEELKRAYKQLSEEDPTTISTEDYKLMQRYREQLVGFGSDLHQYADDYKIIDETSESWLNNAKDIDAILNPSSKMSDDFSNIYNSVDFANEKVKLEELAKAGELKPEMLLNNKQYSNLLEKVGHNATYATDQIYAMTNGMDGNGEAIREATGSLYKFSEVVTGTTGFADELGRNVDITGYQNKIESAISTTDNFKSILENMDKYKGLLSEDLDVITQNYPELLKFVGDETKLREKLTEGIEEQKKVATEYYTDILELDTELYNNIISNNADKVNTLNTYYGIDLQNFGSLAEGKYSVEHNLIKSLTKRWTDYYKALDASKANIEYEVPKELDLFLGGKVYAQTGGSKLEQRQDSLLDERVAELKKLAETEQYHYDMAYELMNADYTSSLVDKFLKVSDKGNGDKTTKEFSKFFDWIERRINKVKKVADEAVDKISNFKNFENKNKQVNLAITEKENEVSTLKSAEKKYTSYANKIKFNDEENHYKDRVLKGHISIKEIKDETLANKISEFMDFTDKAQNAKDQIKGIKQEIKDLNTMSMDNISSYFGLRQSKLDSKISKREGYMDLRESQGKSARKSDYKYLGNIQNDKIDYYKKEEIALKSKFDDLLAKGSKNGGFDKYSEDYFKYQDMFDELATNIYGATSAIAGYAVEIREIDWKPFDDGILKIQNTKTELENLADLISDTDVIDDGGQYTEKGLTKLGLLSKSASESKDLIDDYAYAMKKLSKELKNGIITQEQYDEEYNNYLNLQVTEAKNIESLKSSIADLAKLRIEKEIDVIEDETDAYKKLVDAKKEALRATKDLADYEKSIEKKTNSINTLRKQISTLSLSTNRKDIAERLKLQAKLKEEEEALKDEQDEHSIKSQEQLLDDEYEKYEEAQDEKVKLLEKSMEDTETLVRNALQSVYTNTETISDGIDNLAKAHGISVTDSIVSPWESAKTAMSSYKDALSDLGASTLPSITTKKSVTSVLGKSDGKDRSKQAKSQGLSSLNQFIAGKGYKTITQPKMAELAEALGIKDVSGDNVTKEQKDLILNSLKNVKGFSSGGKISVSDVRKHTGEDAIIPVVDQERVLSVKQNESFEKLASTLPQYIDLVDGINLGSISKKHSGMLSPNISSLRDNQRNINLEIGSLLNVDGNMSNDILDEVNKMINEVPNKILNEIKYAKMR